jgi:hypothetical protein
MKQINKLITHYPLIHFARINNNSYNSIIDLLDKKFNVITNLTSLRRFYDIAKNNKLKLEFNNIQCFIKDNSYFAKNKILNKDYIYFMDAFCIGYSSLNIDESLLINEKTIHSIHDPVARIYAKWFSRNFHIDNSTLLNEFEVSCSEEQMNEIKLIPDVIDELYNSTMLDLTTNHFKFEYKKKVYETFFESGFNQIY